MLLGVQNRLLLSQLLPEKDSFDKLILRKDILAKTTFTQEDLVKYGIKSEGSKISWTSSVAVDIQFTSAEKNYIVERLKFLSEKKELTTTHVELYEAFVNGIELVEKPKEIPVENGQPEVKEDAKKVK